MEARLAALTPPLTHDEMAARVARTGAWYWTEAWLTEAKAWAVTVLGVGIATPVLFLASLGVGLGIVVDSAGGDQALGMPYARFVAPALLVSAAMLAASQDNTLTVMSGFKWKRTYYGPLVTPLTPQQIVSGHVMGVSFRYVIASAIYASILMLFQATPFPAGFALIGVGALTAHAIGLPLMAYASTLAEDKGQFALVNRFVFAPMMLFSGTFFPLESLPIWAQPVGWVSPVWHGTQLGRDLTTPLSEPAWLMAVHLGYLVLLATVGWWLARRTYRRRLIT